MSVKKKNLLFIISLSFCFSSMGVEARSLNLSENTDLIYGDDDRYEANDYQSREFVELGKSVAIRVANKRLAADRDDDSLVNFPLRRLKSAMPQLCPTEKFIEQFSVGDCSGFLIAPDKLVTAGHCMASEFECTGNKWVFDFYEGVTQFKKSNVYSCKKIITQRYAYNETEVSDYAVIQLDREVLGRKPLIRRKIGRVNLNTPLVVIGHPLGLPKKITDGAVVSRMNEVERERKFHSWILRDHYFTANLDAYGGNSGSPVFNKKTGKVEGILIQGGEDFIFNHETECLESVKLSNSHLNTYEKVMRINKIPGL